MTYNGFFLRWLLLALVMSNMGRVMSPHGSPTDAKYHVHQSGYEPLNLENGSFVNSDNFDATNLRF